jgi:hypothetical protein
MPKVHIDGMLVVECSHILPDRWNGWAIPVFTQEQLEKVVSECVRLGWVDSVDAMSRELTDLGNDEYISNGWIWLEVEGENV